MSFPAPILPQAKNLILDKSTLHGKKIEVRIPIIQRDDYESEDIITVYFTHDGISITSALTVKIIPDNYFKIYFPEGEIQAKNYNVYYIVNDTSGNSSKSASTFITVIDGSSVTPPKEDEFFIMGARSTLYGAANALPGPQCLTAWDKNHQPISVSWEYIGEPKTDISWQKNPSEHFYDSAPYLPLTATATSGHTVTLNPLNIFGNGGTNDSTFSDFSKFNPYSPNSISYGTPESFSPSFAALLNTHDLVTWGNINPNSQGFIANNVKKVVTSGSGYLALKTDSTISFWSAASDMTLGNPTTHNTDFVDIGLGSTCAVGLYSDGTYTGWGYCSAPGQPEPYRPVTTTNMVPIDKAVLFGDDIGVYLINTETALIVNWVTTCIYYGPKNSVPIDQQYFTKPRSFSAFFGQPFVINDNGTMVLAKDGPVSESEACNKNAVLITASASDGRTYYGVDAITVLTSLGQAYMAYGCADDSDDGEDNKTIIGNNVVDISCNRHTILLRHDDYSVTEIAKKDIDYFSFHPTKGKKIDTDKPVVQVTCTAKAFSALYVDGTVYAWGDKDYGGYIDDKTQTQLYNVRAIYATGKAFAALTSDNRVVTWGNHLVTEHNDIVDKYINGNISYYV
jgi:hypothetical protein